MHNQFCWFLFIFYILKILKISKYKYYLAKITLIIVEDNKYCKHIRQIKKKKIFQIYIIKKRWKFLRQIEPNLIIDISSNKFNSNKKK